MHADVLPQVASHVPRGFENTDLPCDRAYEFVQVGMGSLVLFWGEGISHGASSFYSQARGSWNHCDGAFDLSSPGSRDVSDGVAPARSAALAVRIANTSHKSSLDNIRALLRRRALFRTANFNLFASIAFSARLARCLLLKSSISLNSCFPFWLPVITFWTMLGSMSFIAAHDDEAAMTRLGMGVGWGSRGRRMETDNSCVSSDAAHDVVSESWHMDAAISHG